MLYKVLYKQDKLALSDQYWWMKNEGVTFCDRSEDLGKVSTILETFWDCISVRIRGTGNLLWIIFNLKTQERLRHVYMMILTL